MRQDGGYEVAPGSSIIDLIWQELGESYAELMSKMAERDNTAIGDGRIKIGTEILQLQGRCAGLAIAIAIIRNPYNPDDDIIRDEVADRHAGGVA